MYRKIVLKLSGEGLSLGHPLGLSPDLLRFYAQEIAYPHQQGTQLIVVVGGGNLWRGRAATPLSMTTTDADHMGMLATLMNSLALRAALQKQGCQVHLCTRFPAPSLCPPYRSHDALHALSKGKIVIIAGGLGSAHFSTDTAATLAAIDLQADALLKATQVDGVYPEDPAQNPATRPYTTLPLCTAYEKKLQVMDLTALSLAQTHSLPVIVYSGSRQGALQQILAGQKIGSLLTP